MEIRARALLRSRYLNTSDDVDVNDDVDDDVVRYVRTIVVGRFFVATPLLARYTFDRVQRTTAKML